MKYKKYYAFFIEELFDVIEISENLKENMPSTINYVNKMSGID
jgi:hypothetical protein